MDSKIKIKEFNIATIGDYWSQQWTIEIVNSLRNIKMCFPDITNI